ALRGAFPTRPWLAVDRERRQALSPPDGEHKGLCYHPTVTAPRRAAAWCGVVFQCFHARQAPGRNGRRAGSVGSIAQEFRAARCDEAREPGCARQESE